jgi:hypothetical protein
LKTHILFVHLEAAPARHRIEELLRTLLEPRLDVDPLDEDRFR